MEKHKLSAYGDCIATYSAQGTLTLQNTQIVHCRFEAGQLRDGHIILLCDFLPSDAFIPVIPVQRFDGITSQGYRISGTEPIIPNDFHISSHSDSWAVFHPHELTIHRTEHIQAAQVRFGITNFLFDSNFQICLEHRGNEVVLSIEPVQEQSEIMWRVEKLKSIAVTCEVVGNIAMKGEREQLDEVVDNLCYLLSVARGTKIQWIYRNLYDENGVCLSTTHTAKVTKVFCPLSIVDNDKETRAFLEKTYSTYVANRECYDFERGTIDAYLDAKAENDYLELRALKLAVAMEALKATMLKSVENFAGEYILSQKDFKSLCNIVKGLLRNELKARNVSSVDRDAIYQKLPELNRRAFKEILADLLTRIQLDVAKQDLDLFVKCRDSLVHQVRFYCQTATLEDLQRVPPLPTPAEEYFFLVNFLDKVFLKLLGYNGTYKDRRSPGSSRHVQI